MTIKVYRIMLHFIDDNGNHITNECGGYYSWGLTESIRYVNNYKSENEALLAARDDSKMIYASHSIHPENYPDRIFVGFHVEPYEIGI
jgi:hypothetical protein